MHQKLRDAFFRWFVDAQLENQYCSLWSYLNMLHRTLFGSRNPPKFYSMSILHWSIFNDLLQAPQGSGGRHSVPTQGRIKAIGSGAPAVGNSTRGRRAWPVIELQDWGLATAGPEETGLLLLLLLPRLLLMMLLLHDSRSSLGSAEDTGNCRGSSKSSCSSASSWLMCLLCGKQW